MEDQLNKTEQDKSLDLIQAISTGFAKLFKGVKRGNIIGAILVTAITSMAIFMYENWKPPAIESQVKEIKEGVISHNTAEHSKDSVIDLNYSLLKQDVHNVVDKVDQISIDTKQSFQQINNRLDALFQQKNQMYNNATVKR